MYLATLLVGTLVGYIGMYILIVALLLLKVPGIKTDSKGIRNLPYQQYNPAWQRFVTPMLRQ